MAIASRPRIALFGGSFNPPHVAHQLACAYVLATARPRVEAVWMVPAFKHPFDKPLAPYADRVAMCERACAPFGGRVVVSRVEEELEGESYTLRTVKALAQRHPGHGFALVIGADLVAERERWHGWAELRELVDFIVIGRGGYSPGSGSDRGGASDGEDVRLPPISSTDVRERLRRGAPVQALLDAEVEAYARARGLYGES